MHLQGFNKHTDANGTGRFQRSPGSKQQKHFSNPQQFICKFFINQVRQQDAEEVTSEFYKLFISGESSAKSEIHQALYQILTSQEQETFLETLNRCCYILINNWSTARDYLSIQKLIGLFEERPKGAKTKKIIPLHKQKLQQWLKEFCDSQAYEDLKVFAAQLNKREKKTWSDQYTAYLLASQAVDKDKSHEQREAARKMSRQLKDQFHLEFAMYTAHANSKVGAARNWQNPTLLGDKVIDLIQKLLAKRGTFSHENLANIFRRQIQGTSYLELKKGLMKYLTYALGTQEWIRKFRIRLNQYLESLYSERNEDVWDQRLLLRTCNRLINYLTTAGKGEPTAQFVNLIAQNKSLALAIILLRVILVCRPAYNHLEASLAYLINYYRQLEEEKQCLGLIQFLEVLTITLTIYADKIDYNLLTLEEQDQGKVGKNGSFRIFSQVRESYMTARM